MYCGTILDMVSVCLEDEKMLEDSSEIGKQLKKY
jgi:hypothetical protein